MWIGLDSFSRFRVMICHNLDDLILNLIKQIMPNWDKAAHCVVSISATLVGVKRILTEVGMYRCLTRIQHHIRRHSSEPLIQHHS